jgi:hypothetical protein
MHVNMRVPVPVMLVLVNVNALPGRLPDAPRTDGNEHQTHEPLAPSGQPLHGEDLAQEQRRDAHDHYPSGVAEPPQKTRRPRVFVAIGGQGRNGRQVIGPGQDVNRARGQARDNGSDHRVPELFVGPTRP